MDVVAMLIESYILESLWLLIAVIIRNEVASVFFNESVLYIEVSSPSS
jgi:hypothetical protein